MISAVITALSNLVFWAVILTIMVLSVRPTPGADPLTVTQAAEKYGRRIGIVALGTALWLASALRPALMEAGGDLWWNGSFSASGVLLQLGAPTVFALSILAVGELTWPRPRGSVRTAVLTHRGLHSLVQRYMFSVALAFLLLDLAILGTVLGLPPAGSRIRDFTVGWLPWLLLTVGATVGILKLVAVRPMVPGTTQEADAALRQASAHRVLRVAAGIFITLSASGGAFLAAYPPQPNAGTAASVMKSVALAGFYLGTLSLLKRAPRVPLPGHDGASTASLTIITTRPATGPSSPLAIRSLASSLRLGIAGSAAAATAGVAVLLGLGWSASGPVLAVAAAAATFLLLVLLTEQVTARRTAAHRATPHRAGVPPTPADMAFIRPPRWLTRTAAGAAVLTVLINAAAALLGPSMDAAAQKYTAFPDTGILPQRVPFFDLHFALTAALLVLLLPLLATFVSRRALHRPSFPAPDRAVDLRLRRVAAFRVERTVAATCLAAVGLTLQHLSSGRFPTSQTGPVPDPPLDWAGTLVQQAGANAWLWLAAALVIALRSFGPSHFPDESPDKVRTAERSDAPHGPTAQR
ncbi:hypothetical protein ABIB35_000178 [Arthrobacter sp. UYP6]|uniref:hypothetical protein n=1 Tax=Arthrobacter sp. UYP6 TaxID=1756378 RepID=UPI00339741F0